MPTSPEYMAEQAALHSNYRMFANTNSKMHDRPAGDAPLALQSPLPPLDAEGWLNETPTADDISGKVLVVDVWDGVCPYCSLTAPLLLKAHDKFSDDAVEFIGLTSAEKEDARAYVDAAHLTWPNAYGAGETIDALGANAPTLFVIGADGHVAWHDDSARYWHDIGKLDKRLEAAIEHALSAM
ncbi:MAG TPA: TlpA disulfide reductase family protein [Pirellulales bacterium]|nr:TlpA disulfide reductase family protein [Pirellulales bacterium]